MQTTRPPTNLPVRRTALIGRDDDVAAVHERVLHADGRLVTLTGVGGCGKTSLAFEVGRSLLDRFPDGVWLVELAPLADPALVPQAVAAVVGIREEADRPILATLTDGLQSRQALILLDNCEHVIAAAAELAEALLRSCPHLIIL